jgi:hypothetical protein
MGKSAVNSNDISVNNAKHRDVVLSIGARYLASTKNILWYCETLILSARFIQLLKLSQWGSNSKLLANRYKCHGFDDRDVYIQFPNRNSMDMLVGIGENFSLGSLRISDREIQAITFHLFLSMLPLHADRPDRQHAFFINALRIFSQNFI